MGTFSTAAKNSMLNALTYAQASLHTGDPGASGTSNEVTGGSPAYARQNITMNSASGGARALASDVDFDVPAGTITHVGFWASGPTFLGSDPVTNETFAGQGIYRLKATTTTASLSD